jgi:hypothetical protein
MSGCHVNIKLIQKQLKKSLTKSDASVVIYSLSMS